MLQAIGGSLIIFIGIAAVLWAMWWDFNFFSMRR